MTLMRYEQQAPAPAALDVMSLGKVLASSNYFADAKDAAQAVVKVLAGQEMGIGPIAAMTGIYIVKGRVSLSANLMAAQIKRSGRYNYRVAKLDDTGCELVFFEQGQEIGRSSFTKADAQAGGLWNSSDPWKKSPRNMLFARAMSNGAKWFCPDVFSGPVYTPDELSDGQTLIDAAPMAPSAPMPQLKPPADPAPAAPSAPDSFSVDGIVAGVTRKNNTKGEEFTSFTIGAVQLVAKSADFPDLADLMDGDSATVVYQPAKNTRTGVVSYMVQSIAFEAPHPDDHQADDGATFTPVAEDVNDLVPDEEPA